MYDQITKKSHYVPVFLLSKWHQPSNAPLFAGKLHAHSWKPGLDKVITSTKHASAFCYRDNFLLNPDSPLRRDIIETRVFEIDNFASKILSSSLELAFNKIKNPTTPCGYEVDLDGSKRSIVAQFVMSLVVRNPFFYMENLRSVPPFLIDKIARDPDLQEMLTKMGTVDPALVVMEKLGLPAGDLMKFRTAAFMSNKEFGTHLIKRPWSLIMAPLGETSFYLSDDPLITVGGLCPRAPLDIFLPVSPHATFAFWGSRKRAKIWSKRKLDDVIDEINTFSTRNTMRYIFSLNETFPQHHYGSLLSSRGLPLGF